MASRGRQIGGDPSWKQQFEARGDKTNALTTVHKDNMVAEPVCTTDGKARTIKAQYFKTAIANLVDSHHYPVSGVAELVKSPPPPQGHAESVHIRTTQRIRRSIVNSTGSIHRTEKASPSAEMEAG